MKSSLETLQTVKNYLYPLDLREMKDIEQDLKLLELLKEKKVNLFMISLCYSVVQYNVMVEEENKLKDYEFSKIKKLFN